MKTKLLYLLLFFLAIGIFLAHFILIKKAVYGDGRYYYSYLPSLLINHTLNFTQSFLHTDIPTWFLTPNKLPANVYPIGPAVFWSIPYLFSFLLSFLFGFANPYAIWIQIPVGIWQITLVFSGLLLLQKSLEKFFPKHIAVLTTVNIFLATNLLFYGAVDVINSHGITFFLSSLLLFFWLKPPSIKNALIQGVLIGLLMLTRSQEIVFLILPLTTLFVLRNRYIVISFLAAFITFFPQMLLWHLLWNTWIVNPYVKYIGTFHFFSPQLLGVLFNHNDGLFLWTPIVFLSALGLGIFAWKKSKIGLPMLLVFLAEIYIVASWSVWWEGASYSGRMFISSLPLLAFGLASLYNSKQFRVLKYFFLFFFSLINICLIIYFLLQS